MSVLAISRLAEVAAPPSRKGPSSMDIRIHPAGTLVRVPRNDDANQQVRKRPL